MQRRKGRLLLILLALLLVAAVLDGCSGRKKDDLSLTVYWMPPYDTTTDSGVVFGLPAAKDEYVFKFDIMRTSHSDSATQTVFDIRMMLEAQSTGKFQDYPELRKPIYESNAYK